MDCVVAATNLKNLLVAHGNAEAQVSALDAQISEVSQQTLVSALEGNRSQDLHLSLHLSVSEGVRLMYHNYQNKKWAQVQETARSIIDSLEGDQDSEQMTSPVTSPTTSSPSRGSTRADKAAVKWSMAFCEFYRDN